MQPTNQISVPQHSGTVHIETVIQSVLCSGESMSAHMSHGSKCGANTSTIKQHRLM